MVGGGGGGGGGPNNLLQTRFLEVPGGSPGGGRGGEGGGGSWLSFPPGGVPNGGLWAWFWPKNRFGSRGVLLGVLRGRFLEVSGGFSGARPLQEAGGDPPV